MVWSDLQTTNERRFGSEILLDRTPAGILDRSATLDDAGDRTRCHYGGVPDGASYQRARCEITVPGRDTRGTLTPLLAPRPSTRLGRRQSGAPLVSCSNIHLPCGVQIHKKMTTPTIRSGHNDRVRAVATPAAMIATLATASFRADRKAARVRLPLWAR